MMPERPIELHELGRRRDRLLQRVREGLEADARVQAAWLSGSFGRGVADEWSDLDLYVVVAEGSVAELAGRESPLFSLGGTILLIQAGFPSEGMPKGTFWLVMYEGAVHIDWNIGPVAGAARPEYSVVLFDRAGIPATSGHALPTPAERTRMGSEALEFFWAMAPTAVKYMGRGHLHTAISQTQLLGRGYNRLWRAAYQPESLLAHPASDNSPMPSAVETRLPRLGPSIDAAAVLGGIRSLCAAVEELHPALAELGIVIPSAMPGAVRELAAVAAISARHPSSRSSG